MVDVVVMLASVKVNEVCPAVNVCAASFFPIKALISLIAPFMVLTSAAP